MNKKIKFTLFLVAIVCSLPSCLKDDKFLNIAGTGNVIEFSLGSDGSTSGGNLGANDPSVAEIDTVIAIDISSPQVLSYPVTVTVGFDTTLLGLYNTAALENGDTVVLEPLPDSCYSLPSNTLIIATGHRIGYLPIKIYPSKIHAASENGASSNGGTPVSYGLPLSILNAIGNSQNLTVSANFGHVTYPFIGNPLNGVYNDAWTRWNVLDTTTAPFATSYGPVVFAPVTTTKSSIPDGTGINYLLSFTNNGGVLSDFSVSIDPASVSAAGITITSGPVLEIADPINGIYRFSFTYNNSAGAARAITDEYTK